MQFDVEQAIFGNYFKNPEEEQASETINTVKAASPEEGGGK